MRDAELITVSRTGPAVASEESEDENEYTKIHGDMEGEDSDGSGSDAEATAGGL